ncbi:MAG: class I SAM-dependent methyltransferase [Candidatus Methanoperedens sp.]
MDVFGSYSKYYDLFYKDKDYPAEINFINSLIKKYANGSVKTILDMGCGTGGHAFLLVEKGYIVTGVDRSEAMLSIAKEKAKKSKIHVDFIEVDIRDFNLNKKFDAIISMFAVMGYQTTNEDFEKALLSAGQHLKSGGLFIFDVWFGPTVLAEKPETRIQEFKKDGIRTIRMVTPELNPISQIVSVKYTIFQIDGKKVIAEVDEVHEMRFFFIQELKLFLEGAGFEMIKVCPFLDSDREPRLGDWNISVVAKAFNKKI